MAGVALGRLWSSHPRIAFVVHLVFAVFACYATYVAISTGPAWAAVLIGIVCALMLSSLAFLTWSAAQDGWRPDYEDGHPTPMVTPGETWNGARTWERVLWPAFALAFVVGLVLLAFDRSPVGLALLLVSIALAIAGLLAGN